MSVAGRDLALLAQAAPYLAAGLVIALTLGRQITTILLGDDIARGLAAVAVVLLAGGAVAVAGPIGFIGLVIPHALRVFAGVDYRWVLPYAALAGAIFLLVADVAVLYLSGALASEAVSRPISSPTHAQERRFVCPLPSQASKHGSDFAPSICSIQSSRMERWVYGCPTMRCGTYGAFS